MFRRALVLATWLSSTLIGCQPAPVATPSVEVRREPVNRRALGTALDAAPTSTREKAPPPEEPVAPQAAIGQCLRSRNCGFEGLCSATETGLCIAATNDDCAPSNACLGGRCTARDGVCVAATDEDCRTSWACKGWGRCYFDGDAACAAKDVEDCKASTRCAREGECRLQGGECIR